MCRRKPTCWGSRVFFTSVAAQAALEEIKTTYYMMKNDLTNR